MRNGQRLLPALALQHLGQRIHNTTDEPHKDGADASQRDWCVEEDETRKSDGEFIEGT